LRNVVVSPITSDVELSVTSRVPAGAGGAAMVGSAIASTRRTT